MNSLNKNFVKFSQIIKIEMFRLSKQKITFPMSLSKKVFSTKFSKYGDSSNYIIHIDEQTDVSQYPGLKSFSEQLADRKARLQKKTLVGYTTEQAVMYRKNLPKHPLIETSLIEKAFPTRPPQTLQINLMEHYDVFKETVGEHHLFNPIVALDICFGSNAKVYFGNHIEPGNCLESPTISTSQLAKDKFYTLIFFTPDADVFNGKNYLHWGMTKAPGSEFEELSPYVPIFPPRGSGFNRYIFFLVEHNTEWSLDLGNDIKNKNFGEHLKPVGASFFQAQWDECVTDVFHHFFGLSEPHYEYTFPEPIYPKQTVNPGEPDVPFNDYLDRYRDRKELAEERLKDFLKMTDPMQPFQKIYPKVGKFQDFQTLPSWYQIALAKRRREIEDLKQNYK